MKIHLRNSWVRTNREKEDVTVAGLVEPGGPTGISPRLGDGLGTTCDPRFLFNGKQQYSVLSPNEQCHRIESKRTNWMSQ